MHAAFHDEVDPKMEAVADRDDVGEQIGTAAFEARGLVGLNALEDDMIGSEDNARPSTFAAQIHEGRLHLHL